MNKRVWLLRIVAVILLLAVAASIFYFSAQTSAKSDRQSRKITKRLCKRLIPGYKHKSSKEKEKILRRVNAPIRKAAHFILFFMLGGFAFLSVVSYEKIKYYLRITVSLGFSLLYAVSDEFHQSFISGRGPGIKDVGIDFLGAVFATVILVLIFRSKRIKRFFGLEG